MADKDEADPTDESTAAAGHDGPAGDHIPDGEAFSGATAMGAVGNESEATPAELADVDAGRVDAGRVDAGGVDGEDSELVTAGARRAARTGNSAQQATDLARPDRPKKEPAPAKQASTPQPTRTGPIKFVKESVGELRKVVYPTGQQLLNYFVVVLVFVLFVIAFVSLLDLAFGAAIFEIFS